MRDSFDPESLENLLFLLDQNETKELFALGAESSINRDSLINMRLPLGMSVVEAENLLYTVKRLFAIPYPIVNEDNIQYWFFPTRKIIHLLQSLSLRASKGSSLDRTRSGEFQTVLDKDSLKIATDHLIELAKLCAEENSSNHGDKFAEMIESRSDILRKNIFHLLKNIPSAAERTDFYSTKSLDSIFFELTQGLVDPDIVEKMYITNTNGIAEQKINEALNVLSSEWSEMGPLLEAIIARWSLQFVLPYEDLTMIVSDIFIRQNLVRKGYHLLQFIPFFTTYIPGKRGLRKLEQAENALEIPYGDLTDILENTLQEMSIALDAQLVSYKKIISQEEKTRKLLRNDLSLNHRQRSILERALRLPDAAFIISYHMKRHDITYSTARKDLFDLAELGYLCIDSDQKAYKFYAAENLQEKLENKRKLP